MGKIRTEKRYRRLLRTRVSSTKAQEAAVSSLTNSDTNDETETMAPLPEEVMERRPVLALEDKRVPLVCGKPSMKKKDRRKQRHDAWLKKIDTYKKAKEKEEAAEERKKTVVVGDIHPLLEALPELEPEPKGTTRTNSGKRPPRINIVKEVARSKAIMRHPAFIADPIKAISQHLENSLARGLL